MVKGAAKSTPLGDAKEEYFVGGIEALKGVERGVMDAVGRAKMIGEGAKGLREVAWDDLGEVDRWVGTAGGRGKLERVVGMVLRVCNAGNGDEELERKLVAEEENLVRLNLVASLLRVVRAHAFSHFRSSRSTYPSLPPQLLQKTTKRMTRNSSLPNF